LLNKKNKMNEISKNINEYINSYSGKPLEINAIKPNHSFTNPIWIFDLKNHDLINESIIKLIYSLKKSDPEGLNRSNRGGWHSYDGIFENEELFPLASIIKEIIHQILLTSRVDKNIPIPSYSMTLQGWANVSSYNHRNILHTHPRCDYSGVYYLKVPKNSGNLIIHNKIGQPSNSVLKENDMYENINTKEIIPKEGSFVLFKSDTMHEVNINEAHDDRISIAFNTSLIKSTENYID